MDQTRTSERIADIVEHALELAAGERTRLIESLCGDDAGLRREVESLVGFEERAASFLSKPAYELAAETLADATGELQPGEMLGVYRIVSLIGEGGMGEVYLAEDTSLGRKVAIKLLKFGMGTTSMIRHFHQEERILAGLTHPHIAQLYGGDFTKNGLPYFVMELVEGKRLDNYCRDQGLSIPQRLALFRKICSAVSYAHQHLVVHRDLKPANIRVTSAGEPKLLDFGIAKLLEPESTGIEATMTFAGVMTPEYASPEQVRGETVTTATDVYSLGVILYELLTGEKPYKVDTRTPVAVARAVTEHEPMRPSAAVARSASKSTIDNRNSKILSGDLDNIVLKAMRKEPARRYASIAQFSEDVQRHLDGRTVLASKDTWRYRSGKFVQRHRVGVAAAALVVAILIGGIIATGWEAHRANVERAIAERRFTEVRQLAHSLMFEIDESVMNLAGATPTRRLIVSRALEYLDKLAQEAGSNSALQRELANAYEKIGDIQGNPFYANLGDTDGALASYQKAMAIRVALNNDGDLTSGLEMARGYRALGDIFEQKGNVNATIENYRRSLSLLQKLAEANPADFAAQDEYARAFEVLGDGLARTQLKEERLRCYQRALSLRQHLLEQQPGKAKLRRSIALSFLKVGGASDPKAPDAIENVRRGVGMLEKLAADEPDNERAYREVGHGYYQLGQVQIAAGDFAGALQTRRKALENRQRVAQQDPKNVQAQFDLATAHGDLAEALTATGETKDALEHAEQARRILEQLSTSDPTNVVYLRNVGLCFEKLAEAYARAGADEKHTVGQRRNDWTLARGWFAKGLQLFSDLKDRGTLMPADAAEPQKFADRVAACDEAVRVLKQH